MKYFTPLLIYILFSFQAVSAQNSYIPSAENLENREWFQDAKFGMFIHWGIYSTLGQGEWVLHNREMDKRTYEPLASFFNPTGFDPEAWVSLARAAGMRYITFTVRHHDGFSMFDSRFSDWNIVGRTPYGRDVLKMLADECRRQGIKLILYYSHLDWYNDDYYPRGWTGQHTGRPASGDWNEYIAYVNAQLTELLTNYGEIAGIWFDGMWDRREAEWGLEETYRLIHSLQPQCLVGNNHHTVPNEGEDFQMFEKDLPGQNRTGYRKETVVGELPLETCETMNDSWGFNVFDRNFKTSADLIRYLVSAAGHNANFLLNVGPMPDGRIQPEFSDTLKEIGTWLETYGETIYGTRGGPVPPTSWGVTTHSGNRVFVHNLSGDTHLLIPDFGKTVKRIFLYNGETPLDFRQDEFGITVRIPPGAIDEVNTILTLEW